MERIPPKHIWDNLNLEEKIKIYLDYFTLFKEHPSNYIFEWYSENLDEIMRKKRKKDKYDPFWILVRKIRDIEKRKKIPVICLCDISYSESDKMVINCNLIKKSIEDYHFLPEIFQEWYQTIFIKYLNNNLPRDQMIIMSDLYDFINKCQVEIYNF